MAPKLCFAFFIEICDYHILIPVSVYHLVGKHFLGEAWSHRDGQTYPCLGFISGCTYSMAVQGILNLVSSVQDKPSQTQQPKKNKI